jgi:type IV secretory pathway VirB10-like protein
MAQNTSVPASPSVATAIGKGALRPAVTGVTRFGARAGLIVAGVLGAIVLAIVFGVTNSGSHAAATTASAPVPQIIATGEPLLTGIPGADATTAPFATPKPPAAKAHRVATRSVTPAQTAPALPDTTVQPALTQTQTVPDIRPVTTGVQQQSIVAAAPVVDPVAERKLEQQRAAEQAAQAARQAAQLAADQARRSAILVTAASAPAGASAGAAAAATAPIAVAAAQPTAEPAVADPAIASQRAKSDFINAQKTTTTSDYLTTPRQAAISPYEVQAGSIIPAILVTGINSDLPGQMIGQVSKNVYDSKTGQFLLIPAGSKLVGRYDSQVVNGQSRVLVAWQRIIFPDSSFIDIGGMTGTDTAGYSGFTGKVDDHTGKLFRNAILFSLIGAGTALLQPRTAVAAVTGLGAVVQTPSVGSQIAGQVGQNIGQVVQQSAQQGVQQSPTIEVRPGYIFNILVDRDLVLPAPYTN